MTIRKWIGNQLYCNVMTFGQLENEFFESSISDSNKWDDLNSELEDMLKEGLLKTFKIRTKVASNEDYTLYYTTWETEVWMDHE